MGFNKENLRRIREEYDDKYKKAVSEAEARREEAESVIPGLDYLNRQTSHVGLRLMEAALNGSDAYLEELAKIRKQTEEVQKQKKELLVAYHFPEDYLNIRYECPDCSDSGYIDGKMCHCMREKLVLAGYESSGIGSLLSKQTFDNYRLEYFRQNPKHYAQMEVNLQELKKYAETFSVPAKDGQILNLLLIGPTGLGKTHLSSAVARKVIERGFDVQYTTCVAMLSDFEYQRFGSNTSGEEVSETSRYYDCDLLILDDLGTEVSNQFTVSCLYNIINLRLNKGKGTLISTNLTENELRQRYWDRITSRLFGEYRPLLFVGKDVRLQKLNP